MTLEIDTGIRVDASPRVGLHGRRHAGVLLLQEIFGVSDYIKQRAADLAALGYYVIAPEIYWRLDDTVAGRVRPRSAAARHGHRAAARLGPGRLGLGRRAGLPARPRRGHRGGRLLLRRRARVQRRRGLVARRAGELLRLRAAAAARPRAEGDATSLHHFGDADTYLKADDVIPALGDAEIHRYPEAGHAFDNPMPAFHHADASELAWRRTVDFLARHLPTSQGQHEPVRHPADDPFRRADLARRVQGQGRPRRERRVEVRPDAAVRGPGEPAEEVRLPRLHRARCPVQPVRRPGAGDGGGDRDLLLDDVRRDASRCWTSSR